MAQRRVPSSPSRRSTTAGPLRAGAPVALLIALASVGTVGQGTPTFSVDDVTVTEGPSGLAVAEFTISLANPNGTESSIGFTTNDGTAQGGQQTAFFPSAGPITLGDGPSSPYGVTFDVAGVTGPLTSLSLLFESLAHPSPQDLDVLLVAPDGTSMVVQSDAGPATNPNTLSYILRDYNPLIGNSLLGGTYGPTSRSPADVFPAPAPAGPYAEAPPEGSATIRDVFGAATPVGTWRAYINDDSPGFTGTLNRIVLTVDTPEAGTDYNDLFGRVTFPPGITTQRVRVLVNGDTATEPDETFFVDLGVPVNGVIGDGQGVGTIRDAGSGGLPPTAVSDSYTFEKTLAEYYGVANVEGVLANDRSNGGGPMTVMLVSRPNFGSVALGPFGGFQYSSDTGFVGTDSFTYRAVNAFGHSNEVLVTITIKPTAGATLPTNLRVTHVRRDPNTGLSLATIRFDTSPAAVNHAINGGVVPGQTLATIPTNSPYGIFTVDGVPNGSFWLNVTAVDASNQAIGTSNVVPLHISTSLPPSAPVNLLGAADGSNLTLAWTNTFTGGIPTNTFLRVTGAIDLTVPLGQTDTFSFSGVPAGDYAFEVLNGNAGGLTTASNKVQLTFPGTCTPPQVPEGFLGYAVGNWLAATWELPVAGPAPTGYELFVQSPVFTGTVPVAQRSIGATVPSETYYWRVRAINGACIGPWTAGQTVVVP